MSVLCARHLDEYVNFPQRRNDLMENIRLFYDIPHFPNISGCIDNTHICIANPGGENAEVFRNRKGRFSLNVQVRFYLG